MAAGMTARDLLVENLLDRLDELATRVRVLEDTHGGAPGETAGKLAYYRAIDGSLHVPGGMHVDGSIFDSYALGCRVIRDATFTVDDSTHTPISFNTEIYDTDGCWAIGDPTKLYARTAGYYLAGGGWGRADSEVINARRHAVSVRANGITFLAQSEVHTVAGQYVVGNVVTGMFWMNVDDYIEINAFHNDGATRTALAASTSGQALCNGWLARIA